MAEAVNTPSEEDCYFSMKPVWLLFHFIDEETETQTSSATCPGLSGAKQNLNPGLSGLEAYSLKHD